MKITIENVDTNKLKFDNIMATIISECKQLDKNVSVAFNNISLRTDDIILSHDKVDVDVLDDLLIEEEEYEKDEEQDKIINEIAQIDTE